MHIIFAMENIKQEVIEVPQKHNIKWSKLNIWETSDRFLVEVESSDIYDDFQGIEVSRKLERKLNDPTITFSILPSD